MLWSELTWSSAIVGWLAMLLLYGVIVLALSLNLRPLRAR